MSADNVTGPKISGITVSGVTKNTFVKATSTTYGAVNTFETSGVNDQPIGIVGDTASANGGVTVAVEGAMAEVELAEAVTTVGQYLAPDSSGKAILATLHKWYGARALSVGSIGTTIPVQISIGGYVS